MKLELPLAVPKGIPEAWEGQFAVFSWYQFVIDVPTNIFLLVARREDNSVCFQLNAWGMMIGSGREPKFVLQVLANSEICRAIDRTGEFTINYPSLAQRERVARAASAQPHDGGLEACGFHREDAVKVATPRIQECVAALECRVDWMRSVESDVKLNMLVQGNVVHAAIDEKMLTDDIRLADRNRGWVYYTREMLNPRTGHFSGGVFSTLDCLSSVSLQDCIKGKGEK